MIGTRTTNTQLNRESIKFIRTNNKNMSVIELSELINKNSINKSQKLRLAELIIFLSIATRKRFSNNKHNVIINLEKVNDYLFLIGFPKNNETNVIANNLINICNIDNINEARFMEFFKFSLTIPNHVQTFINQILNVKFNIHANAKLIEYIFKNDYKKSTNRDYLLLFNVFNKSLNFDYTIKLIKIIKSDKYFDMEIDELIKELNNIKNIFKNDGVFSKFLLNLVEYNLNISNVLHVFKNFLTVFNKDDKVLLINQSIEINKDIDKIVNPNLAYILFKNSINDFKEDANSYKSLSIYLINNFSQKNKDGEVREANLAFETLNIINEYFLLKNDFNKDRFNELVITLIENCTSKNNSSIINIIISFKLIQKYKSQLTNQFLLKEYLFIIFNSCIKLTAISTSDKCQKLASKVLQFFKEHFIDNNSEILKLENLFIKYFNTQKDD